MLHLGVLGERLGHSLSPDISRCLMEQKKISGSYHVMEVEKKDISKVIEVMKMLQIRGLNVTIPYKEIMMDYVDEVSGPAKEIGALNTICLKNGKTYGYNTDYSGVLRMLSGGGIELSGKRVTILGNGGAARAVIVAVRDGGADKITVVGRHPEALEKICLQFPFLETASYQNIPEGDLMINTTPVGMYPYVQESPVERKDFSGYQAAADIVYNPLRTMFLKLAEEEGLKTVSGLSMLVDQAVSSHEIWLEQPFDHELEEEIEETMAKKVAAVSQRS